MPHGGGVLVVTVHCTIISERIVRYEDTMNKLILARHGHVDGINPPRFRGRWDVPLSKIGLQQASALAERIRAEFEPVAVYTSPLSRCVSTGQAIEKACSIEAAVLQGLHDLDYGDWQGRTHQEIKAAAPEIYEQWLKSPERVRFPNGESLQDLVARASEALREILAGGDGTAIIVGHDSVNRALLLHLLDLPLGAYRRFELSPASVSEIVLEGETTLLCRLNDTAHLQCAMPITRSGPPGQE